MTTYGSDYTGDEMRALTAVSSTAMEMAIAMMHGRESERVDEFMADQLRLREFEVVRGEYVVTSWATHPTLRDEDGSPLQYADGGEVIDIVVDDCLALLVSQGERVTAIDIDRLTQILEHHPTISAGMVVVFTPDFDIRVQTLTV